MKHYSTLWALLVLLAALGMGDMKAVAQESDQLTAEAVAAVTITRGPYIQVDSFDGITLRWRTDVATNSRVYYSTNPANQNLTQDNSNVTTDHSVTLNGLATNTKYYYKVGSTSGAISPRLTFLSIPDNGHPLPMRFWVLGDSGQSAKNFTVLVNNYLKAKNFVYPNLIVMLGDNAYDQGNDDEYQSKFFDITNPLLSQSIVVSALGEHDTAGSTNPPPSLPYFSIFDLPSDTAAGGRASGTEKYYSFNMGNIHWVALDSQASNRSPSGSMLSWLEQDLTDNHRPWIIAFWHHSPYSKGNFNSDTDPQMSEMRQNANQILERHGVDLVLGAHSATYERSFLIDGHYGTSDTFVSSMLIDGGNGRLSGDGAYEKAAESTNSGTVYVVMGTSGGKIKGSFPLNHPAMFTSLKKPGSVAIDLNCAQMDVKFLSKKGKAKDNFTMIKTNIKPDTNITAPADGATFRAPADITLRATATDPDTRIRKVRFVHGTVDIGQDFSFPYSVQWNNVPRGTYTIEAIAEDELCGNGLSTPITITVN